MVYFCLEQGGNSIRIQKELNFKKDQSYMFTIFGDSSNANRVNEIFEDTEKNVWIGTGLGLCKIAHLSFNRNEWTKSFYPANQVLNSRINYITQDKENNVWFAGEKGIARYNDKNDSIKSYTNISGYDLALQHRLFPITRIGSGLET